MSGKKLSQKEYLKKYLAGDSGHSKKHKKRKVQSAKPTISIVDDDFDIAQLAAAETDLDNYNLGEDLPQIAGIIDDRPAELIAKEDYKSSGKWKTIGEGDTESSSFKKPDSSEPIRNVEDDDMKVRERKTGRRRNFRANEEKELEKLKKEEERKKKYSLWGKGLKQLKDHEERVATVTHEMAKPVARYADDKDLENHQKSQYLDGDPMMKFLKKSIGSTNVPSKPVYQGSFPENRFNIRPGYRWDGVDRSNGYEKKWFDIANQKKATEEEAYKYSVEDM